jgi:hypothetical protein
MVLFFGCKIWCLCCISNFQAHIKWKLFIKFKSIQTKLGGEYIKLNTYFKTVGIPHQIIYPHTYEQNNTIKSHHRYIMKTNLTFCLMKNTLELISLLV